MLVVIFRTPGGSSTPKSALDFAGPELTLFTRCVGVYRACWENHSWGHREANFLDVSQHPAYNEFILSTSKQDHWREGDKAVSES